MYNFLCSDSLLYFFLFLSTLHSVYTRDCSCSSITVFRLPFSCIYIQLVFSLQVSVDACIRTELRAAVLRLQLQVLYIGIYMRVAVEFDYFSTAHKIDSDLGYRAIVAFLQ